MLKIYMINRCFLLFYSQVTEKYNFIKDSKFI